MPTIGLEIGYSCTSQKRRVAREESCLVHGMALLELWPGGIPTSVGKVYFPEDPTLLVHQLRVCPSPDMLPAGIYVRVHSVFAPV